ncbi:MAG: hypothetical protein U0Q16_09875 [Bryobacteraceae bacterium]
MTRYALVLAVTALAFAQKRIAITIDGLPDLAAAERTHADPMRQSLDQLLAETKAQLPVPFPATAK